MAASPHQEQATSENYKLTDFDAENVPTPAKKGVPGFSDRLNQLFDKAGAPTDTRLSWGSKKWSVVPNTIKNWLHHNIPPQQFATLEEVVGDLLKLMNSKTDRSAVIGWLYAGGKNPFDRADASSPAAVNHVLQLKIYNALYEASRLKGIDLNNVSEKEVNQTISAIYQHLETRREKGLTSDIMEVMPVFAELIAAHN